jgi:nicotinamidase-related amidase
MRSTSAVLVVVDVQNYFIQPPSAHIVPIIADLVSRWQDTGADVVFTRYLNYPDSPFERLIGWAEMQGSPQTDIVAELQPYAARATVLDKTIYSLFSDEGDALVRERGWTDLYICGAATESCVLKTAVDAFERDLTPWVIEDASASHSSQAAHDAGVFVTQRFIGEGQIIRAAQVPISASSERAQTTEGQVSCAHEPA